MRNILQGVLLAGASFVILGSSLCAQATPIKTVLFKNGFSSPIFVTAPPGDFNRVFVVERAGKIKIVKNGTTLATPFLDITALTTLAGERGLLSMAFHPNFAANGYFFVYYTNSAGNIVIARYKAVGGGDVASPAGTILLTINHPTNSNHNGGQVAFGPDGYLYFATGDGGSANDPPNNAQNLNSLLGKMLRIDVNLGVPYGIPSTNPFASSTTAMKEIWAIGHRNPFRFSFDRVTGDLVVGDVGQDAWEEIDFQAGTFTPTVNTPPNYGWRCLEGTHATNLAGCTYPNPYPNAIPPIYEYPHSTGNCVIGGYVYRGCMIPDLRGTYFFADNGNSKIWSFVYSGGIMTNFQERTSQLAPGGGLSISGIPSFGEDAMGEMYIVDMSGGEIFKIVPQNPVIVGISNYGVGTPGCLGSQTMSVNCSPVIANPGFELLVNRCPTSSLGLTMVTDQQDVAGSDPFSIGVLLHVGFGGSQVMAFDANSDALGNGITAAPIPNNPTLVGQHFYATTLWAWSTSTCTLPGFNPFNLSTSDALDITIQP
ncbi:MAG: PQQ-dependent sugar dehydrogenase [Planctomycetes bacterium]|nr:PQQ-dependent sugar dehydrogenase [Planctomycetota bacterium]